MVEILDYSYTYTSKANSFQMHRVVKGERRSALSQWANCQYKEYNHLLHSHPQLSTSFDHTPSGGKFKSVFAENVMVSFLFAWFLEQFMLMLAKTILLTNCCKCFVDLPV